MKKIRTTEETHAKTVKAMCAVAEKFGWCGNSLSSWMHQKLQDNAMLRGQCNQMTVRINDLCNIDQMPVSQHEDEMAASKARIKELETKVGRLERAWECEQADHRVNKNRVHDLSRLIIDAMKAS